MGAEQLLSRMVRIGTVTAVDGSRRTARVKFRDTGGSSGWLHVLAARPFIPGDGSLPPRTEKEDGGSGEAAFASHSHELTVSPWLPRVNAVVLVLFLPVSGGDGFILGEIGAAGSIKQ